jgi:hypothetical protein
VKTLKNQVDIEKGKLKACKSQLGLREDTQLKLHIAKLEESSTKLQNAVQMKTRYSNYCVNSLN